MKKRSWAIWVMRVLGVLAVIGAMYGLYQWLGAGVIVMVLGLALLAYAVISD